MVKARFLCISKTGQETFTVQLVPLLVDICPICKKVTSEQFCQGNPPGESHIITEVPNGDRSFFQDIPHGDVFLSVLTKEAASQFEVGKITAATFELES